MDIASDYYSDTAFRPAATFNMDLNGVSKLGKLNKKPLWWGDTKDIVPPTIFEKNTPSELRAQENKPDLLEKLGFQAGFNQEFIRFENFSRFSAFLDFLTIIGKVGFFFCFPLALVVAVAVRLKLHGTVNFFSWETAELPLITAAATLIPWLGIGALVQLFPRLLLRPGKGPEWELNRRTGMVKIWKYPPKKPFLKRGAPEVIEEPFTAFNPWISALGDRHGANFRFQFIHRDKDIEAYLGIYLGVQRHPVICYAYWQFLQNYMDVTKPIPDIPILEKYRQLDPVTAEYDRKTNRPERYWRDMDDKTWKQKKREEFEKVMACHRDL